MKALEADKESEFKMGDILEVIALDDLDHRDDCDMPLGYLFEVADITYDPKNGYIYWDASEKVIHNGCYEFQLKKVPYPKLWAVLE